MWNTLTKKKTDKRKEDLSETLAQQHGSKFQRTNDSDDELNLLVKKFFFKKRFSKRIFFKFFYIKI